MRTRSSSVGCPTIGRKANVAVARATARAVGVMVAGWEGSGDILVAGWEIVVDFGYNSFVNVCKRETHIVAEKPF